MHNKESGINFEQSAYTSNSTENIWFNNQVQNIQNQLQEKFSGQYSNLLNNLKTDRGYASSLSNTDYNILKNLLNFIIIKEKKQKIKWNKKK